MQTPAPTVPAFTFAPSQRPFSDHKYTFEIAPQPGLEVLGFAMEASGGAATLDACMELASAVVVDISAQFWTRCEKRSEQLRRLCARALEANDWAELELLAGGAARHHTALCERGRRVFGQGTPADEAVSIEIQGPHAVYAD